MRIGRTIPPAAAPLSMGDLVRGLIGILDSDTIGKLEREIREYFGSEFVFLVSSGKAALVLILKGLATLRSREKVLIPAYTCYSVPSAIVKSGFEIVLCDIDPDTFDFDYDQLERLADESILCVVSTHLFGISSDVDRVRRICERKGIFLLEDAAQAMGILYVGRQLGTIGDVGFLSLGRGKNITCGSGGIILTSSEKIAEAISNFHRKLRVETFRECLRNILEILFIKVFLTPFLYWLPFGLHFLGIGETRYCPDFPMYRFSNFKAGVLGSWRERMQKYNGARTVNGRLYIEELAINKEWKIYASNLPYLRFPVFMNDPEGKDLVCRRHGALGISPMYPGSVNRIEQLREDFEGIGYPGAERVADVLVTLPTHVLVTDQDRKTICHKLEITGIRKNKGKGNSVIRFDNYGEKKGEEYRI